MNEIDMGLLTEFQEWSRAYEPPLDVDGVLATRVRVSGAAALVDLMCPILIEVRGAIVLARSYSPESFDEWWQAHPGDIHAIESVLNHVHLWDVFRPNGVEEHLALEAIAERMAICWRAAAQAQFPDRTVSVVVTDDYGPTLTLTST